jgi:hypothetical protein
MKNIGKILAVGAACSACLVVPAVIAAVGGTGLAAASLTIRSGWLNLDALMCAGVPLLLLAGIAYFATRTKNADPAACAADSNCGCKANTPNKV